MAQSDLSQPIQKEDGSNYVLWAQGMSSFLKGRKLWRYITGNINKPVKKTDEKDFPTTYVPFTLSHSKEHLFPPTPLVARS